jgi:hypothetical protein
MVAALAASVDDLVVGQHGAERIAPPDRCLGHVGEPPLRQAREDPLRPAIEVPVARVDLARPVVAEAERLELPPERLGVVLGRDRRVLPHLDRVLLGRQAERVPTHRVQDVVAAHAPVPRDDVGRRVALGVADVEAGPRRVREHVEDVELLLRRVEARLAGVRRLEDLLFVPERLPLRLERRGVVGLVGHGRAQIEHAGRGKGNGKRGTARRNPTLATGSR